MLPAKRPKASSWTTPCISRPPPCARSHGSPPGASGSAPSRCRIVPGGGGSIPAGDEAEVGPLHRPVAQERRAGACAHHAPPLHDVGPVGQLQGGPGVLLHQQHRHPPPVDGPHDVKHLPHHQRRQPQRGLVQQQQAGLPHQGPPDGQHLLLPPGERPRPLPAALGEEGERREHRFQGAPPLAPGLRRERPQLQVLQHGQAPEQPAPFRHQHHPAGDDLVRGRPSRGWPSNLIPPLRGRCRPAMARRRVRLARAVGAHQGHDLARLHPQRDVPQGPRVAVGHRQAVDLKQHGLPPGALPARRAPPGGRPQAACAAPR